VLVDEFLPVYDVSDSVATVVEADLGTSWEGTCPFGKVDTVGESIFLSFAGR
jgi:hypothetical protein